MHPTRALCVASPGAEATGVRKAVTTPVDAQAPGVVLSVELIRAFRPAARAAHTRWARREALQSARFDYLTFTSMSA